MPEMHPDTVIGIDPILINTQKYVRIPSYQYVVMGNMKQQQSRCILQLQLMVATKTKQTANCAWLAREGMVVILGF